MIRINLLPHREMRREKRKRDFVTSAVISAAFGAVIVFAGGMVIDQMIGAQDGRNTFIKDANKKLDLEIAEIRELEAQIQALQARQKAVEDLQADRTIPVHLFDELVRLMPEGVFLQRMSQQGMNVAMSGFAQSNERVAELYQNLADRSQWFQKPQLVESKEVTLKDDGAAARKGPQEVRRVYEFNVNVAIRNHATAPGTPGTAGADSARQPATSAAISPAAGARR